ncbi:hypothetical protein DNU06_02075 [Putridiphycobacter roseus]|uniref:Secretion system C-terminal sorting domain-containing protein n=1 Tax=Putridiphycobacter roseus TaxID=2219161 RepID=A0A2W1N4X3_9FLAO|nr:T9SS type A sorting domain-containing protein [Putridiphycobacter roseus]PZE18640.1 hypothetical protein DNU06_02075 [Putridiphycobacter roseus]
MKAFQFIICLLLTNAVFAQPYMVQDVNSNQTQDGISIVVGASFNNWYYYSGNDTIHGAELWKTDGDTCILVADLFQGTTNGSSIPAHSGPQGFIVYNNVLYFNATDSVKGPEIWQYDGVNQPIIVSWLPANTINSMITTMRVFNNALYIIHDYNSQGVFDIYKYDGTTGTVVNSPLESGTFLTEYQNKLYFSGTCTSCNGLYMLWEFDGVSFTTVPNTITGSASSVLPSIYTLWGFRVSATVYQNEMYFVGFDTLHGFELWKYDGLSASMAFDCFPGPDDGMRPANNLKVYNGNLYFAATEGVNGTELWEFDGAVATMVQDVNASNGSTNIALDPIYFETFNGNLYFTQSANGTVAGTELWEYDGASVQSLTTLYPNEMTGTVPKSLKTAGSYMYFNAKENIHGRELWRLESCNIQNSSTQSALVCQQYVSISGDTLYSSGIYKDTLTNICGGDSVVKTYLTVNTVDASVTQNGFSLQANSNGVTYQWIDCDDAGAIIPGETSHLFEPATNGNYALIVTNVENGCTDTSACHTIAGLAVNTSKEVVFSIYPNPSQGQFNIQYAGSLDEIKVTVYTLLGQEIPLDQSITNGVLHFTMSPVNGFVLIKIATTTGVYVEKLRVE